MNGIYSLRANKLHSSFNSVQLMLFALLSSSSKSIYYLFFCQSVMIYCEKVIAIENAIYFANFSSLFLKTKNYFKYKNQQFLIFFIINPPYSSHSSFFQFFQISCYNHLNKHLNELFPTIFSLL